VIHIPNHILTHHLLRRGSNTIQVFFSKKFPMSLGILSMFVNSCHLICSHIILLGHHVLVFILTSLLSSFLDVSCIVVVDHSTLLSCYTLFASPHNKIRNALLSLLKFFLSDLITPLLFNTRVLHLQLSTSLPLIKFFLTLLFAMPANIAHHILLLVHLDI
jgi:hypothetical protein